MNPVTAPAGGGEPEEYRLDEATTLTREAVSEAKRLEMEELASRLKDLVLSQPPQGLLGYLWAVFLMGSIEGSAPGETPDSKAETHRDLVLFALEYVHAILSCFGTQFQGSARLQEDAAAGLVAVAERLREATILYCMASSRPGREAEFGDETANVEFDAKTKWVLIRGNRYPVLEEEFFRFILEPHDGALRRAYGIGAHEVATGIQAIADATRKGFARAKEELHQRTEAMCRLADEHRISLEKAMEKAKAESPEVISAIESTYRDLLYGGLCNLSRHTKLPATFLEDLSFRRGENTEFFAPGPFCGTPLRTLPARIKPLVQLDDGFYATDPFWVRDAAYRAVQRGLVTRLPEYREEWNRRQKTLTEDAFPRIFKNQLEGASVLTEVWYRDPATGQWAENDTLILLDDVLLQVEAKAGIGAMHSPATNFQDHVRAIQGLVVTAYMQAKRFFDYLASVPEVALHELRGGQYIQVRRVRLSDYRLAIPIGLTVESFSPFSAMCKELPEVTPLLGRYPFVSMSIDDLFVLNRFLPAAGELFHYLQVRQEVAGIRGARIFDELEHLGAYIKKNRFDMAIRAQLAQGADVAIWDGFQSGAGIDQYFEGDRWLRQPPPRQSYPDELERLLKALTKTRAPGWLGMDAMIRDFGDEARSKLAGLLRKLVPSLREYDRRYFVLNGERCLLVWLCKAEARSELDDVVRQAEIAALATKSSEMQVLRVSVTAGGEFTDARGVSVQAPPTTRSDYGELAGKAQALWQRMRSGRSAATPDAPTKARKKPRPNEPCWCGSGRKYKKCHGSR